MISPLSKWKLTWVNNSTRSTVSSWAHCSCVWSTSSNQVGRAHISCLNSYTVTCQGVRTKHWPFIKADLPLIKKPANVLCKLTFPYTFQECSGGSRQRAADCWRQREAKGVVFIPWRVWTAWCSSSSLHTHLWSCSGVRSFSSSTTLTTPGGPRCIRHPGQTMS